MNIPQHLKYTKSHEWVKCEKTSCVIGVTEYAQKELSDVVYVELPDVGHEIKAGDAVCVVESVKAAFDIYTPISGTVSEINTTLDTNPAQVNTDPYGAGWFFKITPANRAELDTLMNADEYKQHLSKVKH